MSDCTCDIADWVSDLPMFITMATKALVLALQGRYEEALKIADEMEKTLYKLG